MEERKWMDMQGRGRDGTVHTRHMTLQTAKLCGSVAVRCYCHCLSPSPEATRAELTGETHAVLQQPCSHLFGGWVLGAVLHCLLTAHTGY